MIKVFKKTIRKKLPSFDESFFKFGAGKETRTLEPQPWQGHRDLLHQVILIISI